MNGVTNQLVSQIANALNSTNQPVVKDSIPYRILVFKEKGIENWVLALLPEIVMVEEIFLVVNESFDSFKAGAKTPCGIYFICASRPELLVSLAKEWYYKENSENVSCI